MSHKKTLLILHPGRDIFSYLIKLYLQWCYPSVEDEFRFHMTLTVEIPDIKVKKFNANF